MEVDGRLWLLGENVGTCDCFGCYHIASCSLNSKNWLLYKHCPTSLWAVEKEPVRGFASAPRDNVYFEGEPCPSLVCIITSSFTITKLEKQLQATAGIWLHPKRSVGLFFLWSSKVFTHQHPATIASQSGIYIGAVLLGKVCVTSHENLCIYFVFSLTASSSCIPCEVEGNRHAECEECKAGYLVQGRFRGIWRQMNVIYIKHTGVLGCN